MKGSLVFSAGRANIEGFSCLCGYSLRKLNLFRFIIPASSAIKFIWSGLGTEVSRVCNKLHRILNNFHSVPVLMLFFLFIFMFQILNIKAAVIEPTSKDRANYSYNQTYNQSNSQSVKEEISQKRLVWNIDSYSQLFTCPVFQWGFVLGIPLGIIIGLIPLIAIAIKSKSSHRR